MKSPAAAQQPSLTAREPIESASRPRRRRGKPKEKAWAQIASATLRLISFWLADAVDSHSALACR